MNKLLPEDFSHGKINTLICKLFDTLDHLKITSDSPDDENYADEGPLEEYWDKEIFKDVHYF